MEKVKGVGEDAINPFFLLSPEFTMKAPAPTEWQGIEVWPTQSETSKMPGPSGEGKAGVGFGSWLSWGGATEPHGCRPSPQSLH